MNQHDPEKGMAYIMVGAGFVAVVAVLALLVALFQLVLR